MIKIKIITLVILSSVAAHSFSDDCNNWQNKVTDTENKKRQGGSSNRMNHLQKQLNYYEEKLKTYNYWIGQHNQNPSFENQSHKENSCRDAKNMASEIISPNEKSNFIQTRTVKECMKPNNVIDRDVKLCAQGLTERSWNTKKALENK